MTNKYKYIFLDLDDTIWDFHANAKESLHDVFYAEKLDEHFEDFENFYCDYSKKNLELWTQYGQGLITKDFLIVERFLHLLQQTGINDPETALKMNTDFLEILGTKTGLVPYARELMDFCREKTLPMTIISNGFVEVQYRKLRSAGIEHYFAHVLLSEAVGTLKPDRKIFEYAPNLNKARKEETVMIGDSFDADITGASQIGIDAIFLNHSDKKHELPDNVTEIHSLKDAINIILTS